MVNNLSGGITSKGKLNGSLAIGKIGGTVDCKKNVYVGEVPQEYTEVWFDPSVEGIVDEVATKKFVEERTVKLETSLDNMASDIEELKQGKVLNVYNIKTFDEIKEIQFKDGDIINITDNLLADSTLTIDKNVIINGNGHKITCTTQGLNKILVMTGKVVKIRDIDFDMALLGRSVIYCGGNDYVEITGCSFTGYSLEYGYDANDGAVVCNSVKYGVVERNRFVDHGGQYTPALETLNRCVAVSQSNSFRICKNYFYHVSQCIVTVDFNDMLIEGNTFDSYVDNGIYIPNGCRGAFITNNSFINSDDECIVLSGWNVRITNNSFLNCQTAVATNGAFRHSTIENNVHTRDDGKFCTFFRCRPTASSSPIENLKIVGNVITGTLDYAILWFRETTNLTIEKNIITLDVTESGKRFIYTDGKVINLVIKDNVFTSTGTQCDIYYNINTGTPSGLFSYNVLNNVTFKWIGGTVRLEGHRIDSSLKLYMDNTSRITCNGNPEGNIKAVKGSIISDVVNGNAYIKTTDTSSTTGWVKLN